MKKQPNVLFIFADQLSAVWMGCYGNPDVQTPNLDRLASAGTRFDYSYSASPLCTPYRGTLLTGRYPSQTGIIRNECRITPGEVTLADAFNRGGYHTCYVGKWHVGGPPRGSRWVPPDARGGFTDFVGWECDHVEHWNQTIFDQESREPIVMLHDTDGVTDFAIERLQRCAVGDKPFCMFVSHQAPHPTCKAPENYRNLYRGKTFHWRDNSCQETIFQNYPGCGDDLAGQEFLEEYFAEITHLDAAVGRLLDELDRLGLAENTIVAFSADHGEMASSHGLYGKIVMYDESIRVPLLVRLPSQQNSQVIGTPVSSVDIFPTLLDACGLDSEPTVEGVSFASQLTNPDAPASRETVYIQLKDKAAILKGQYTLVVSPDGRQVQAFLDSDADPSQCTDFKDDPAHRDVRNAMAVQFTEWLADIETRNGDTAAALTMSPAVKSLLAPDGL